MDVITDLSPANVIIWTCVLVFIFTAIAAVLDLFGIKKIEPDSRREKVFVAVILSVFAAGLSVFNADTINNAFINPEPLETNYRITVKTSNHENAATDAGAFTMTLVGDRGIKTFGLDNAGNDRRKNATDTYAVQTPKSLGEIREIAIVSSAIKDGHDGWLFESAKVENLTENVAWSFRCNIWIESDNGGNLDIVAKSDGTCE